MQEAKTEVLAAISIRKLEKYVVSVTVTVLSPENAEVLVWMPQIFA
jgi:hypothetical protein